ncbi:MAG: aminotransferase class V-fold PLP-dependent enzyme, partial [Deltaproteobacteria bacterium]|nr:aminotransferase class V-fold PLP-dependent enzyme [Deltaproteobacteria bacterium]
MTPSLVHLDHNAATPPCPAARAAAGEILDDPELGNPSSSHLRGQRARARLDAARRQIAKACGVDAESVVFTSGATEADAIGIRGAAQARGAERGSVAWLGFDHPAITKPAEALVAEGWSAVAIAYDTYGRIDVATTVARLAEAPTPRLLAIAAVHHELGVIQPVQALLQASAETAAIDHLHLDLAQAAGRVPLRPLIACADTAALSAQKCGGLAGSGALIVGPGARITAQQAGRQERGLRGGTQNLIGAVAFGAAAAELENRRRDHRALRAMRDAVLRTVQIRLGEVRRFGGCDPDGETGHVLAIAMPWADADVWVAALDVEGVA